jgi:AcrR family transcriptional regulator
MAKPRVEPRQQRSRDTYDRILNVAAEIFTELGYAGTTTNKVAEAAGISIGTLYHYVQDKDALLYALAERHLSHGTVLLEGLFQRLRETQPGLEGSLRAVIKAIVVMHVHDFHMHHLLWDSAPRSRDLQRRMYDSDRRIATEVAWHLEHVGVAKQHTAFIADMMVAGVERQVHRAIIDPTLHGDEPTDPELVIDVLTQLWTRALAGS